MIIKSLGECPQFINTVIEWLNDEFGSESSRDFYKGIIEHSLIENDTLLGTVGIWRGDLLSRQDLFPWFSGLVINKNYRNLGIGQELQKYVLEYCKLKGMKELFLYTDLIGYYEKSGWIKFDIGYEYMGDKVSIYKYSL